MSEHASATATPFSADFGEQTGFFNPALFGYRLTLIGCGGIGGSVAPVLGTLGVPEVQLFDNDLAVPRNVAATLLFGPGDVLQPKVATVERELRRLGVTDVTAHRRMFDPTTDRPLLGDFDQPGIVVSGVDSMATRREIWDAIANNPSVALYLDGRTGGDTLQLNIVRPNQPDDVEWYEQFQLFDDDHAAPLPCTMRNVVYTPAALGAIMASRIARFSRDEPTGRMVVMHMGTLQTQVI